MQMAGVRGWQALCMPDQFCLMLFLFSKEKASRTSSQSSGKDEKKDSN